jgi:hypothetical protein
MGLRSRAANARLETCFEQAASTLADRLNGTPDAGMTLFIVSTAIPLQVTLGIEQLGAWKVFVPGHVIEPSAFENVLAVTAFHAYAWSVENADVTPEHADRYLTACGCGLEVRAEVEAQRHALAENNPLRSNSLLGGFISDALCRGTADKLMLSMTLAKTLSMAREEVARRAR